MRHLHFYDGIAFPSTRDNAEQSNAFPSLVGTKQSHHKRANTFDSYSIAYPESSGSLVGTKPRVLGVNQVIMWDCFVPSNDVPITDTDDLK